MGVIKLKFMHLKAIFIAFWKASEYWNLAVTWNFPPVHTIKRVPMAEKWGLLTCRNYKQFNTRDRCQNWGTSCEGKKEESPFWHPSLYTVVKWNLLANSDAWLPGVISISTCTNNRIQIENMFLILFHVHL